MADCGVAAAVGQERVASTGACVSQRRGGLILRPQLDATEERLQRYGLPGYGLVANLNARLISFVACSQLYY